MYCAQCGRQLPDNAAFCSSCGKPTSNAGQDTGAVDKRNTPATKRGVVAYITYGALAAAAFAAILLLFISWPSFRHSQDPEAAHRTIQLLNGTLVIKPGQVRYYSFTVDSRMMEPHITGWYKVEGDDPRSPLRVAVIDEEDLQAFAEHAPVATYYYKEDNAAIVDVNLAPGRYRLVFGNDRASSTRTVYGNISYRREIRSPDDSSIPSESLAIPTPPAVDHEPR